MTSFLALHLLLLFTRQSNAQADSSLTVSDDGNCGASFEQTCLGSRFGDCCSGKGFCGSTVDYCGADCQNDFGSCTSANPSLISSNGDCGATDPEGQICLGSTFGNCCSEKGFCGSTSDYCGTGCQSAYGNCGSNEGDGNSTSSPSTASSFASTPSAVGSSTSSGAVGTAAQEAAEATSKLPGGESSTEETGMSTGAIAGVAVGAVGGAALLVGAAFFFIRRRRQQPHSDELQAGALAPKSTGDGSLSTTTSTSAWTAEADYGPVPPPKGPVEMSASGDKRVELSTEHDFDKKTSGTVVELPSERYS